MKTPFLSTDFLLDTLVAQRLYHDFAAHAPIIDFHNHLSARDIAENRSYESITPLWLDTDHYKWRAMRANGVPEDFITGSASDYDRFHRWAETVPFTLRNPLYHWTHLELERAFGISLLLDSGTARTVYDATAELLASPDFTTRRLVERSKTITLCTTDDPTDSLEHHRLLRDDASYPVLVLPTFRPDRALEAKDHNAFSAWTNALRERTGDEVSSFDHLVAALENRHDAFHDAGCRLADHGLETFPAVPPSDAVARKVFDAALSGKTVGDDKEEVYRATVCYHLARMNHARDWTQQFHVGPIRNVNSRLRGRLGRDAGCDSIGDRPHASNMADFLDRLDREGILSKTILYNVNPRDNALFSTMAGNFNDGSTPGKVQHGPPWWYLDQFRGIVDLLNSLSDYGLLARFVGMVTDSRSVLSLYSRHEYFRRILCRVLGRDVVEGLLPNDIDWIGGLVRAVCSGNAEAYFGFERRARGES